MKITRFFYFYVLVFVLILSGCSKAEKNSDRDVVDSLPNQVVLSAEQFKTTDLQIGHIDLRRISGLIRANGMLDVPPQNLVTISAPLGGFVKNTDLLQGMKVNKGQVLVTLEHPDYIQMQQDYLETRSQLEYLRLEYLRQQELAKENVNAAKALQQSRSNFLSAEARSLGLSAKLRFINIDPAELEKGVIHNSIQLYSPISGYVTQVNINIGMHVNAADVMLKIVDNHHLHAEAQIFEKDIPRLKIGQTVHLTLSNDSKDRLAKVYLIGKEITGDRTVRVHCHLDGEDNSLIPGTYFSALIETDSEDVTALPDAAIVNFEGKDYIFVASSGTIHKYQMTEIKKGQTQNGYTAITPPKGVDLQSQVVIKGAYELLSFLKNTSE